MAATLLTMDVPGWWTSVSRTGSLIGTVYTEDGFLITDAAGGSIADASVPRSMSSGAYLIATAPKIVRSNGATFGATTLDVDLPYSGGLVTISAKTLWGADLRFTVGADNAAFVYQTIVLPAEFSFGLVELTVQSSGANAAIDNVTVDPATVIGGNGSANTLNGSAGNDDMRGWGGDDTLIGGAGKDILDGGLGTDTMSGGQDDDVYYVNVRTDVVTENANEGIDLVIAAVTYTLPDNVENLRLDYSGSSWGTGNALDNVIWGNSANNTLRGLNGNDTLRGGGGDDDLQGGWGDDLLDGQAGHDVLTGGGGADRFQFNGVLNANLDMGDITDFSRAQGDKIELVGLDAVTFIGTAAFVPLDEYGQGDFGQFRYEAVKGGVRLEGDQNGDGTADWSLVVLGVSSLQQSDFVSVF